jgi:hydrogenase expression/formation protein HypE
MAQEYPEMQGLVCPVPLPHEETIVLGHGSGGKLMHDLIVRHFMPYFSNPILQANDDAGLISFKTSQTNAVRLAISTDSHVVWPLFFPGGDIGRLAVCGTVNDVAMLGAHPLYLTAGFILEEGLPISTLERILASMQAAASEAGIQIVAGDTKVVQKGKADGLYINTAGVGVIDPHVHISGANAQPGDVVLLSGSLGEHGIAVLEERGELGFSSGVRSDVAPLNHMVANLLQAGCQVHVLRDPTRGGLATTLNEIAHQSSVSIHLEETAIPVKPAVAAACEMLGFDPLYIANEGKLVVILPASDAQKALDVLRSDPLGAEAVLIGQVKAEPQGRVLLKTLIGATRLVDVLSGELLPRIC